MSVEGKARRQSGLRGAQTSSDGREGSAGGRPGEAEARPGHTPRPRLGEQPFCSPRVGAVGAGPTSASRREPRPPPLPPAPPHPAAHVHLGAQRNAAATDASASPRQQRPSHRAASHRHRGARLLVGRGAMPNAHWAAALPLPLAHLLTPIGSRSPGGVVCTFPDPFTSESGGLCGLRH